MLAMTVMHAGTPLLIFTPLTATTLTVAANDSVSVSYQVTNQSRRLHSLVMQAIPGVRQVTSVGHCPNPFVLDYQQSCILSLIIDGSALKENILGGPMVCSQGNLNQCYQPSPLHRLVITRGPDAAYTLGGTVFGLVGTIVLANNNGVTLTLNADDKFTFPTELLPGSTYAVTIQNQPANQTCTVANSTGIITNANITNITVNCSTNTRTIGGQVTGLASSESVTLQNNGTDNLIVTNNGSFNFSRPVAQGSTYNVTVLNQPSTQTCTVSNGIGTAEISNVTNVQVNCATNAYMVGGIVSGLSGTVVLQNNGVDPLSINSNGSFTFSTPVAQGAPYNVTVSTQPIGQNCIVTNSNGTMGGGNVTNVGVTCTVNTTVLSISTDNLALSVTGLTEYGISGTPSSGLARIITIINTGSNPAVNLSLTTPNWPLGTTSLTNCGSTLAAGSSCTITVTPGATATSNGTSPCSDGTAPVPGVIEISADNTTTVSSNVVVLNYGCIYQGGYVYAFDDTTPDTSSVGGKVIITSDQASPYPNGIVWSSNGSANSGNNGSNPAGVSYDLLPGIDQLSTSLVGSPTYSIFAAFFATTYTNPNPFTPASFAMCNGKSDGACNTSNIVTFYNRFITNNTEGSGDSPPFSASNGPTNLTYYATGLCKQSISNYSDWYLPAICELGYGGVTCGASNAPVLQNIQSSLIDTNILNTLAGLYWSSTEFEGSPNAAWYRSFASGGSFMSATDKDTLLGVRCSRILTF
ncbi:hypothetical protein ACNVED_04215 [Legionella sp. D16C41]|uniref:hypothetical protein n=1 Tax=Legionella sp. D16C41 TaxID=3402688 RepID=UPI003AF7BDD4